MMMTAERSAAVPALSRRRSLTVVPPQIPAKLGGCSSAQARHSVWTRQPAQTALAAVARSRWSGNHEISGRSRQAASACHARDATNRGNSDSRAAMAPL